MSEVLNVKLIYHDAQILLKFLVTLFRLKSLLLKCYMAEIVAQFLSSGVSQKLPQPHGLTHLHSLCSIQQLPNQFQIYQLTDFNTSVHYQDHN